MIASLVEGNSIRAKDKNVPKEMRKTKGIGDVWTWTAIDADTQLVPSWFTR